MLIRSLMELNNKLIHLKIYILHTVKPINNNQSVSLTPALTPYSGCILYTADIQYTACSSSEIQRDFFSHSVIREVQNSHSTSQVLSVLSDHENQMHKTLYMLVTRTLCQLYVCLCQIDKVYLQFGSAYDSQSWMQISLNYLFVYQCFCLQTCQLKGWQRRV